VHFPALWTDPGFTGTLPRGTPVAQVIALPVVDAGLEVRAMDATEVARSRSIAEALQAAPGVYRKDFRE
jgi:hypothetical protein